MKAIYRRSTETAFLATASLLNLCTAGWAGPPPPPNIAVGIPSTPVGSAEMSAITVAAVAAYGYWKMRR